MFHDSAQLEDVQRGFLGAYASVLNDCILVGNVLPAYAVRGGGGAAYCTLNRCILTDNSAWSDGVTEFKDTNAMGKGPYFYRVGVQ